METYQRQPKIPLVSIALRPCLRLLVALEIMPSLRAIVAPHPPSALVRLLRKRLTPAFLVRNRDGGPLGGSVPSSWHRARGFTCPVACRFGRIKVVKGRTLKPRLRDPGEFKIL